MSTVGQLKNHLEIWKRLTNDSWILNTIMGYKLEFVEEPVQSRIPCEIQFNVEQYDIVENEIQELLKKGAIIQSKHEEGEFISNIFIVPKSNGKFRPIINLKKLNQFIQYYNHFKQETFKVVLDLIQENDFFTKIDLTDAYFSVPIHDSCWKYLKFSWNNKLYSFVCLPFGLSCAPYLFTKIMKPIFAWFRQQSIRCSYYIDDSLNMDRSTVMCQVNSNLIRDTLVAVGFGINYKKSVLVPCQRIEFFGFILDSVKFMVFLTEEKIGKIVEKARKLLKEQLVVVRELASFIGLIINAFYAVLEAKLHYRDLERNKILGLQGTMDFDRLVELSVESRNELNWWIDNISLKNGKRIRHKKVDFRCRTDASLLGYGCFDLVTGKCSNGQWSVNECSNAINYLELLAIGYSLKALYSHYNDVHIEIQTDNTCAVSYVNEFGGMSSKKMDSLSKQIWEWCLDRHITISACHVAGDKNEVADFYSRDFSNSTEWMLKPEIFSRLIEQLFIPDIDLFASSLNKQMEAFCSWRLEPGAMYTNAFTVCWEKLCPYIFPPFNLVGKVINKIVDDKVERAIIVFPIWQSQTWFSVLLEHMCSFPIRLPRHRDLLTLPHDGTQHPLGKRLKMGAVVVSGNRSRVEAFRKTLPTSSSCRGPVEPGNSMATLGKNGICGIVSDIVIHFIPLKL